MGWSQVFEFSCLLTPTCSHTSQRGGPSWRPKPPLYTVSSDVLPQLQEPKAASWASGHPSLWLPIRVVQGCRGECAVRRSHPRLLKQNFCRWGPGSCIFPYCPKWFWCRQDGATRLTFPRVLNDNHTLLVGTRRESCPVYYAVIHHTSACQCSLFSIFFKGKGKYVFFAEGTYITMYLEENTPKF